MKEFVTGMNQKDEGVEITLGEGVEKAKMEAMAAKCGPEGTGCDSDCCDPDFDARIEGIDISGLDDDVTMLLRGAVYLDEVADKMGRCDCYNES